MKQKLSTKLTYKKLGLIFLLAFAQYSYGQTNSEKALELGQQAIKLMDKGHVDESIELLEEAQKLNPKDINYPYVGQLC